MPAVNIKSKNLNKSCLGRVVMKIRNIVLICIGICALAFVGCDKENKGTSSAAETTPLEETTKTAPSDVFEFVPNDKYTYRYQDGAVVISDEDGEGLLNIPLDIPLDSSMSGEVILDDYNFDGYTDFSLMYSQGNSNSYYYFWMYNKDQHYYVKYDGLSNIASPVFDKQNETITSFEHISATDNTEYLYFWQDGQLRLSTRKVQELVDEGLRFTTYITDENKNESVQKTFTINNEAASEMNEVIFVAEDVAKAQFDVHNIDFVIEYMGTEEIEGKLRHKISFGQAYEVVVTLYPSVGNFEDMLAVRNDGEEKFEKVNIAELKTDTPET